MDYIKVQYFGTIRLILKTKEEIIKFNNSITLGDLVSLIEGKYKSNLKDKFINHIFYIYPQNGQKSMQFKFPQDENITLYNKSTVKIVSTICGDRYI